MLGTIILTGKIAPTSKYLYYRPMTYINSILIITNQLAYENVNDVITFSSASTVYLKLCCACYHPTNNACSRKRVY